MGVRAGGAAGREGGGAGRERGRDAGGGERAGADRVDGGSMTAPPANARRATTIGSEIAVAPSRRPSRITQ